MKNNYLLSIVVIIFTALCTMSCNNAVPNKDAATATIEVASAIKITSITNPRFSIAPEEYAELSEKALTHLSTFQFDAWADMMADNVEYAFPDGDVDTRTKLEGKAVVIAWWNAWKQKSGVESMTMSAFNHFPLNVTQQPKGGALMGNYDFCYFSNKIVTAGKPVLLRMNFVSHFNADKKIDRYITYYDRTVLIKATSRNMLEELKTKK